MSTFLLVHGAWQGASTWDCLVPHLQRAGHAVIAATLTGLGDDSARLTPAVNLNTHIEDVVSILQRPDLGEVILVGHSYAGMVITGVAARSSEQPRRLIYLDAFIPEDGQSALDLLPEAIQTSFRENARKYGNGWRLPAGEGLLDLWGLTPGAARDYVRERLCDFSLPCFEQQIRIPRVAPALTRTFVASVAEHYPARAVFGKFAEKARQQGWKYHELPTGHDCHVEATQALAAILLSPTNLSF